MTKPKQSVTERQQYWLDHIKAADASDGSLVEYAAAHDLKVKDLYQWKTMLSRRGLLAGRTGKRAFVSVAARPVSVSPTSCTITLRNGVRLQFAGALDAATLGQILSAAGALP